MIFQLAELQEKFSELTYYGVACVATVVIAAIVKLSQRANPNVPTVGPSGLLGRWSSGVEFMTGSMDVIQEGFNKHKSTPFKVAFGYGWMVILSSRKHIEELLRAPRDELSRAKALDDRFNFSYTVGDEVFDAPYHISAVRSPLTRNIRALYPEIRDEIVTAFEEALDLKRHEWKSVSPSGVIQHVVCRASNRLFVGLPLCRDPDWIDLNIRHTLNIVKAVIVLGLFPKFLRPLAVCLFPAIARDHMRGLKHLGPSIEERLKHLGKQWAEKPNDLLSWLIDEAEGPQLTLKSLSTRVLVVNFASIHLSGRLIWMRAPDGSSCSRRLLSFGHILFYLVANPQYIQPLREEVEAVIERDGWSKVALRKMRKVDSFIKECERLEGASGVTVTRKAMKDFTFSDGTFIPAGTLVSVATRSLHRDKELYENPDVFAPFRFVDMHRKEKIGNYQFTSTAIEYLPFGHGREACPGRFLASSEMKTMLAHIVTTYDVKLEDGAALPQSVHFGLAIAPDPHAKVLFKRRVD